MNRETSVTFQTRSISGWSDTTHVIHLRSMTATEFAAAVALRAVEFAEFVQEAGPKTTKEPSATPVE